VSVAEHLAKGRSSEASSGEGQGLRKAAKDEPRLGEGETRRAAGPGGGESLRRNAG